MPRAPVFCNLNFNNQQQDLLDIPEQSAGYFGDVLCTLRLFMQILIRGLLCYGDSHGLSDPLSAPAHVCWHCPRYSCVPLPLIHAQPGLCCITHPHPQHQADLGSWRLAAQSSRRRSSEAVSCLLCTQPKRPRATACSRHTSTTRPVHLQNTLPRPCGADSQSSMTAQLPGPQALCCSWQNAIQSDILVLADILSSTIRILQIWSASAHV